MANILFITIFPTVESFGSLKRGWKHMFSLSIIKKFRICESPQILAPPTTTTTICTSCDTSVYLKMVSVRGNQGEFYMSEPLSDLDVNYRHSKMVKFSCLLACTH